MFSTMIWLAAPIIASRVLSTIQESVDTIFLGRLGEAQLAAPVAVWPLLMLFAGVNFSVGAATSAMISQLVGARKFSDASKVAGELWGTVILLGVAAAIAVSVMAPLVFKVISLPPQVYPLSLAYLWVEAVSVPFMFTLFFFTGLSSSVGDTRKAFRASASSSIINLVLDPILIFGLFGLPRMEVIGAALATSISRILAGGYVAILLVKGSLGFQVLPKPPSATTLSLAFRIGMPVAIQQVLTSSGFLVMTGIVAGLGATVMAAYNVGIAIIHIIQSVTMGFSIAMATMVGQSLGAGLKGRALEVALRGQSLVFITLSLGAAFIVAGRGILARIFTSDPEVAGEAVRMIEIFAPSIPFLGLMFTSNGVGRGSGSTLPPSIINVARLWALRIPLSYTLAYLAGLGSDGVWLGMSYSNIISGLVAFLWVAKGGWARSTVIKRLVKRKREKLALR